MKRILCLSIACFMIMASAFAQADSTWSKSSSIFGRLTNDLKDYRPDTSAVPDDKVSRVITELRNLRGVFNINEAIEFKLEEDRQKKEITEPEFEKLSLYFKTGNGKKWLDNAVTRIYRQHFTYRELKKLVKFYKTTAGQKMATEFPVVMMKSLVAAETIKKIYEDGKDNKK